MVSVTSGTLSLSYWLMINCLLFVLPPLLIYAYFYALNSLYIWNSLHDDWPRLESTYAHPGCFWIALEDDRVAGMIALDAHLGSKSLEKKDVPSGEDGLPVKDVQAMKSGIGMELRRLVVHPDFRRRGIARMLVNTLIQHAKKVHADYVYLTTVQLQPAAHEMYMAHGFTLTRRFSSGKPFLLLCEYVLGVQK